MLTVASRGAIGSQGPSSPPSGSPPPSSGCPHTLAMPAPPHAQGGEQEPQSSTAAHPSETAPQLLPRSAQVFGAHEPAPHTLGVPAPPQVSDPSHSPHHIAPPHPSRIAPP